jgi:hypothetical protein
MDESEIQVTKSEQIATYRQIITPMKQENVPEILLTLLKVYRASHITGPVTLNFRSGGVSNLVCDQIAHVPEGSAADKVLEHLFGVNGK